MMEKTEQVFPLHILGDLSEIQAGINVPASKIGSGTRYITVKDVYENRFVDIVKATKAEVDPRDVSKHRLQNGDIVLAKSSVKREGIGYGCLLSGVNEDVIPSGFTVRLRVNPKNLDPAFLFYSLRSDQTRNWLIANSQASALTNLNSEIIHSIPVVTPPLPEQKKIAAILTSVDEVIENTQKQIDKLQDLKKATMNELLTKGIGHTEFKDSELGRIPKSWSIEPFKRVVSQIKSGLSRRLSLQDIGLTVVNSGNLQGGHLDMTEVKYWYANDPQGANTQDYILEDGDILLNFINSLSQIGKSAIYRDIGRPAIYTTNLFRIKAGKLVNSEYLFEYMQSQGLKRNIELITKPAVNQASFTKEDLGEVLIAIPPMQEQVKIASILTSMDKTIGERQRKLKQTQSLKKSLMQDLLTGRVRVNC